MSIFRLVLGPAIITLAVTLLRLVGELNGWSRTFFNPDAGGGFAVVGIAWLVPIFGIYFALKLHSSGSLRGGWRALGFAALAIAVFFVLTFGLISLLGLDPNQPTLAVLGVNAVASLVSLAVAFFGVPTLAKALTTYGLLARIPVVLVMLAAILGNWGTHYDVVPPGVPEMSPLTKWFLIGVVPQLTFWMAFTVVLGAFFGGIALAHVERRRAALRPA
ncbi:MAG: hypothetical protein ACRD21_10545 [Vicinamibacteria bacterium]